MTTTTPETPEQITEEQQAVIQKLMKLEADMHAHVGQVMAESGINPLIFSQLMLSQSALLATVFMIEESEGDNQQIREFFAKIQGRVMDSQLSDESIDRTRKAISSTLAALAEQDETEQAV